MSKTESRSYGDLKFEVEKITELEDLIGNWHDQQVFKLELEKYITAIQKRKSIDAQTKSLMTTVKKDYKTIFKQTVKAVYDHYKIPSGNKKPEK
jgi:cytochrome c556